MLPNEAPARAEQSGREDPGVRAAGEVESWLVRHLTPEEREWVRGHYPDAHRDYRYLALLAVAILAFVIAAVSVQVMTLAPSERDWTTTLATGVAALLVGSLVAWRVNPRRLSHSLMPRRLRPPRRAWVFPTEVFHWEGKDRDGTVEREVRCRVEGGVERVLVGDEQFAWFPEGPARAEMITSRTRRLYRVCYPSHTVEIHPVLRLVPAAGTDALPEPIAAVAAASPARPAETERQAVRRRRSQRHGQRTRLQRRRQAQLRSLVWFLAVCVVGGGMVFATLRMQDRVIPPPQQDAPVSGDPNIGPDGRLIPPEER